MPVIPILDLIFIKISVRCVFKVITAAHGKPFDVSFFHCAKNSLPFLNIKFCRNLWKVVLHQYKSTLRRCEIYHRQPPLLLISSENPRKLIKEVLYTLEVFSFFLFQSLRQRSFFLKRTVLFGISLFSCGHLSKLFMELIDFSAQTS